MALLQISEPGQSLNPHQRKYVVGIDLGTTHSLVATFKDGFAQVIKNEQGESIIPSVVNYTDNHQALVGQAALNQSVDQAQNTIVSVKRLMGRSYQDLLDSGEQSNYRFAKESEQQKQLMPNLQTDFGLINPVKVSADILKHLQQLGEQFYANPIDGAVITVPAYFNDAQRQATKEAASLIGLPVLRLLNEPTAAAIAYGLDQGDDELIAVYDLGGGTFDISILHLQQGVFQVKATAGDTSLGGDDFDRALAQLILQKAAIEKTDLNLQQRRALTIEARRCKEALSESDSVDVDLQQAIDWQGQVNRDEFEQAILELVKQTLNTCEQALKDAGLSKADINNVVLVGGSTRVPLVRKQVEQYFEKTAYCDLDPDQVVALGASIQADYLAGNRRDQDLLLLDVVPLSLGLETMGGIVEKVIPRNTPIPVAKAQEFTTYKNGQTAMSIHILQGERDLVEECRSLGQFELRGIPPMVAGAARIQVTFRVDENGLLEVSAMEQSTGVSSDINVKPAYGLSEDQIASMLQDAYNQAGNDKDQRQLRELTVEAKQLLEGIDLALSEDRDLLNDEEFDELNQSYQQLAQTVDAASNGSANKENLQQGIAILSNKSELLAERRMDRAIHRALAGSSLDDINEVAE